MCSQFGADVNWRNQDGDTPLIAACRRGHVETATVLIVNGADVNATGQDSYTPLHISCNRGDFDMVNILLDAHASISAKADDGDTPVDIAIAKGYDDIHHRLMQYSNNNTNTHETSSVSSNNQRPSWHQLPALQPSRMTVRSSSPPLVPIRDIPVRVRVDAIVIAGNMFLKHSFSGNIAIGIIKN